MTQTTIKAVHSKKKKTMSSKVSTLTATAEASGPTIAIIGASGKLGGATLSALLSHDLHPASRIVALTSSPPGSQTWEKLASTSSPSSSSSSSGPTTVQVRHADFDGDPLALAGALRGVDVFFLVSTPRIVLDFGDAPHGEGREKHHFAAIDAAVAAGVKVLVYSSLAFAYSSSSGDGGDAGIAGREATGKGGIGDRSKAGVMRAHLRTEAYLAQLASQGKLQSTVIREGLYNESWPLYMGYFDIKSYLESASSSDKGDQDAAVAKVKLAGDGKISWTSIRDLGVGSAVVLSSLASSLFASPTALESSSAKNEFAGKTFYLSNPPSTALTLSELAGVITSSAADVAKARGTAEPRQLQVQIVSEEEHIATYTARQGEESKPGIEWWASSYAALKNGECHVDDPTLARLLERIGVKPTPMEETVQSMLSA